MKNKNIFIDIKNNEINVKEGFRYDDNDFCMIANEENLYNLNQEKLSFEDIIELYKNNVELSNVISNAFTIIIIDKNQKKLCCIQDMNGDTIPMYYYKNTEIIITNRLTNIVKISKELKMNEKSISTFLKYGFISNKETLVKDIYKLMPKYNLHIDLKTFEEKSIKKKIKYTKIKKYSTDLYITEFEKIIAINQKDKRVFTTLSNGYDSNFIFSFLDKNKPIEAFSVGGVIGTDETVQVKENIKGYKNVNLNTAYVSEETLEYFPDLIYRLEGAIYEKGIFLQYELSKCVKGKIDKEDKIILFAGEGADQVFSINYYAKYYSKILVYLLKNMMEILLYINNVFNIRNKFLNYNNKVVNKIKKHIIRNTCRTYEFLNYIITKKNGILMNDIEIEYVYPYINRNIINMAYSNIYRNFRGKKSHIKACKEKIDSKILQNICKVGGTTDVKAIFEGYRYFEELERIVTNSKFNIYKIDKNSNFDLYREYLLKILYLEIFEYLFIGHPSEIEFNKNIKLSEFIELKLNQDREEKEEIAI